MIILLRYLITEVLLCVKVDLSTNLCLILRYFFTRNTVSTKTTANTLRMISTRTARPFLVDSCKTTKIIIILAQMLAKLMFYSYPFHMANETDINSNSSSITTDWPIYFMVSLNVKTLLIIVLLINKTIN